MKDYLEENIDFAKKVSLSVVHHAIHLSAASP